MNLLLNQLNINLDAPSAWGIYFQDSASPQFEGLVELHEEKLYVILLIIIIIISSSLISLIIKIILSKISVCRHILAVSYNHYSPQCLNTSYLQLNLVGFLLPTFILTTIRGSYFPVQTPFLLIHKRGYSSISGTGAARGKLKDLTKTSGNPIRNHSEISSGIGDNNSIHELKPFFITGFTDAEGSFMCIFRKRTRVYNNVGWRIEVVFQIGLHKKDEELLKLIQRYLGVGDVAKSGDAAMVYIVRSLNDIRQKIIPHFENYPLKSQKLADYLLWKEIVMLMGCGDHLTDKGVRKILNLRASLNLGLSDALKSKWNLSSVTPVRRPNVELIPLNNTSAGDCEWVAGFTSGEGTFKVRVMKSLRSKVGFQTRLEFGISQHSRDEQLMTSLIDFFGCGQYKLRGKGTLPAGDYYCVNFSNVRDKIIPFFKKHTIKGIKLKDFGDWCKVAELMQNDIHKNAEGLEIIRNIKSGMNSGREWK